MSSAAGWLAIASPWLMLSALLLERESRSWNGSQRSFSLLLGVAFYLGTLLAIQPLFWSPQLPANPAPLPPLITLLGMMVLVSSAWAVFGADLHPIIANARGLPAPHAYTFHVLGMSAVLLASASVAFGWYPLPLAFGAPESNVVLEIGHCAVALVMWKIDALLMRWLSPHYDWPTDATSLVANYKAEHGKSLAGALLACLGVVWFEVYIQQLIASPLTQAGWPLLASALLISLSAGLVRHPVIVGTHHLEKCCLAMLMPCC